MEYRPLGSTGVLVSAVGLGTAGFPGLSPSTRRDVLAAALAMGITYLEADVRSREALGRVWGGSRDSFFLAARVRSAGGRELRSEWEEVMRVLDTDWVDAAVLEITGVDQLARALDDGGAILALEAARERGEVRFLGASCHRRPALLRRALLSYPFALVQFPLSPLEEFLGPFLPVLEGALGWRRAGVVAVKALGGGGLAGYASPCIRWVLERGASCVLVGARHPGEVEAAARAPAAGPLSREEEQVLREVAARLAQWGSPWWRLQ